MNSSTTPKLSVLLPVYNERDNLRPLLEEIEQALVPARITFEVVAVDDRSTDGSAELLAQLAAEKPYLRVVCFRANRGQTAAFDAGFRHASGEIIVTMDADRQNDPNDIPKMLAMIDQGYDFVAGWRRNRQDGFVLRKFPSKIANWLIRRVTGTRIHDLGCSLKVYRKEITDELRLYGEMHRFIAVLCEDIGARVGEFEVHHRARAAGESKYGLSRTFKVLLDLCTVWFLQRYGTKPIYVFGGIGGLLAAMGTLLTGVVAWEKWHSAIWVHRNPLFLIAIFCWIVGVQFIMLGLLAEVLIRTYFEARDERPYSVARKYGFAAPAGLTRGSSGGGASDVTEPALGTT